MKISKYAAGIRGKPPRPEARANNAAAVPVAGEDWRSVAACWLADPDLFFPISLSGKALEQVAEAKVICGGCRVRRECLAFALAAHPLHGVWGGMSEQERYQVVTADGRKTDPAPGDGYRRRLPADDPTAA